MNAGADLAKDVFQVAYKDSKTSRMVGRQPSRKELEAFLTNCKTNLRVIFEACGSSLFRGRHCKAPGHEPMIIPAEITSSINNSNKDDLNDAHSIWQVSFLPGIMTIQVMSEENQAEGNPLKGRDFLLKPAPR